MTGALLAGGKSERMGFNKALIEVDGVTIIEREAVLLRKVFDEVFIVANEIPLYEGLSLRIYSDIIKGAGSIGGIYTALFHSPSEYVFVAACDMPFLDERAVRLISSITGYDAVIPDIGGRLHPLHALYSKKCMKTVEEVIRAGDLRISNLVKRLHVKKLSREDFKDIPIESSVENINTREDLLKIPSARIPHEKAP